jgi:hypothetical protein
MAPKGVVGMSQVVVPNSTTGQSRFLGTPAMWSFVWVAAAVLLLFMIHVALLGRR